MTEGVRPRRSGIDNAFQVFQTDLSRKLRAIMTHVLFNSYLKFQKTPIHSLDAGTDVEMNRRIKI